MLDMAMRYSSTLKSTGINMKFWKKLHWWNWVIAAFFALFIVVYLVIPTCRLAP